MGNDSVDGQLNSKGNKRGMHPNSRKNLKPENGFQKGKSGNAKGGPKKENSWKALIDEELDRIPSVEEDGFDGKGKSNRYWVVRTAVRDARSGDKVAREQIFDRTEGKVTQPIGGEGGGEIILRVKYDDSDKRA